MLTISVGNGSFLQYTLLYIWAVFPSQCACRSGQVVLCDTTCSVGWIMFQMVPVEFIQAPKFAVYSGSMTQHATATSEIDLLWGITGSRKQGLYAVEIDARFFSGSIWEVSATTELVCFTCSILMHCLSVQPFLVRLAVGITFNLPAGARGLLVGRNGAFPGTYSCMCCATHPYLATCVKDLFVEES